MSPIQPLSAQDQEDGEGTDRLAVGLARGYRQNARENQLVLATDRGGVLIAVAVLPELHRSRAPAKVIAVPAQANERADNLLTAAHLEPAFVASSAIRAVQ